MTEHEIEYVRGTRAALMLSLYGRTPEPGRLLLDGIAVRSSARGRGVETRLPAILHDLARREGYREPRLDGVDANPAARRFPRSQP